MGSLRFRLTAIATLIVIVVLGTAATVLFLMQRSEFSENIDSTLDDRATAIEELLSAGALPASIVGDDDDRLVQVVDASGGVLLSSENLEGQPALVARDPRATGDVVTELDNQTLGDQPFRILSRQAGSGEIVHVGESLDDLEDTSEALVTTLALIVPAIAAAFAALAWTLVGRTLRPVDALRSQVDAITDTADLNPFPKPARDDEIGRLTTTLNDMIERLQDSSEKQRRFVADAAHELRTPLTRIRTTVEVDLAQPQDADHQRTNTDVQTETIGMQRLIDDLLLLASGDDNATTTQRVSLDFDDIVRNQVTDQRRLHPDLRIDGSNIAGCELVGDERQMERAVQNLLSNACRHAESNVIVTLRENGGATELLVDDDGPGVPEQQRQTIFDRFARLDEARTRTDGGTGLGLAIVHDIAQRHNGTVRCDTSPSGGARFTLTIPHVEN